MTYQDDSPCGILRYTIVVRHTPVGIQNALLKAERVEKYLSIKEQEEVRDCQADFEYAMPSFVEGAGRILDFGNTMTEYNSFPAEQAAALAISAAWRMVGTALAGAISQTIPNLDEQPLDGRSR